MRLVGGGQRDDLEDGRGLLLGHHPLLLHRHRQLRHGRRDAVLDQHLREVQVGANVERDRERVAAIRGAGGLHVEHLLDAVDLLLDGQRDRLDQRLGAGAGVGGRDLHSGRCDGGYCATGRVDMATPPSRMMTRAMTLARTGRSMKNLANMASREARVSGPGWAGRFAHRRDLCRQAWRA